MIFDLHIHSKYSYDSLLNPEKILKIAKKKGLNGVAITDHNTIKGGIETLKINKDSDFQIIVGSEIKTEYGDIIGLFLNEEIYCRKFFDVIDEIKSQGGLVILPHPYRSKKDPEEIIHNFDYIEGINSRSKKWQNKEALKLAKKYNKSVIAGSDAHFGFEIARSRVEVSDFSIIKPDELKFSIIGCESNYLIVHGLSIVCDKILNNFKIFN